MFSQLQDIVTSCFLAFFSYIRHRRQKFLQKVKNFKKLQKFLEKHGSRMHISSISLLKSDRFSKTHIYSERGNFGAASYAKNSIFDFFRKTDFSEGGGPLKTRFILFF